MIEVGAVFRASVPVRDSSGQPATPGSAAVSVMLPDMTTTSATATPDDGVVRVEFVTTEPGLHRWRLETTDPITVHSDAFVVVDTTWPAFVGLAQVKRHLNMPPDDTTDDDELRGFILSASAVVEDIVGVVAARTITETLSGGEQHLALDRSPVMRIETVTVDGAVVDPGEYAASPAGLLVRRSGRWPQGFHNITVTYVAGRSMVPANLVDATLELIRVNWRPQQGGNYSAFDMGGSDDFGVHGSVEASLQGNLRLGFFVPNTVTQRLQPDQRGPVVL